MEVTRGRTALRRVLLLALVLSLIALVRQASAADHGDAPLQANDRQGDIGDTYFFLDPNDNTRVILAMTVQGFIVPGEAVNFGFFDQRVRYRFELETTGDAKPDHFVHFAFSEKTLSGATAQTATVTSTFFEPFTGPTTVATLTAAPGARTITPAGGALFFAGIVDDPFFFDIPGFARFVSSVNGGVPNPSVLTRGRDTFAGYDTLAIALSLPVAQLQALLEPGVTAVGLNSVTFRPTSAKISLKKPGKKVAFKQRIDRAGNPAVNVALIPFGRKNEFNKATTEDDAKGVFAGDIVATLAKFGTNQANIDALAGVAVAKGDFLHLNLTTANSGPGGGDNGGAGFPNGRRLKDDVIDIILTIVANGSPLGDSVSANEIPVLDNFPFFAFPHQPRDPGVTDDLTRN
jgi:hypothetical protein